MRPPAAVRAWLAALAFAVAGPALGQGATLSPPPERFALSPGGVDMRSGVYAYSQVDLSIGGESGLALTRTLPQQVAGHANPFGNFSHEWDILLSEKRIHVSTGEFSHHAGYPDYQIEVSYGGRSQTFRSSFANFEQVSRAGYAVLTYSGDRNSGTVVYTYQAADGTVALFRPLGSADCSSLLRCAYVSQVTQADGTILSFDYDTSGGANATRLRTVTSSRGYALMLEYASGLVSKACVLNLSIAPVPASHLCPASAQAVSAYAYTGDRRLASATDAAGAAWTFSYPGTTQIRFHNPGEEAPFLTNTVWSRANDDGLIEEIVQIQAFADGSGFTYGFGETPFVSGHVSGIAGGSFTDALGHTTSIAYDFIPMPRLPSQGHGNLPEGPDDPDPVQYQITPGPAAVTDPLGRTTTYDYCDPLVAASLPPAAFSRCLVSPMARSTTDPEGIRTDLLWDNAIRALLATHQVAKPDSRRPDGSAWPNIDRAATYACSPANFRFCTRPVTLTDARGNVAAFTYAPQHGGVLTETGPPPAPGAPAPQTRHAYAQRRAWIRNAAGTYEQAPTAIWVRISSSTCRTSAATGTLAAPCAIAGDEVRTDYDYGPETEPNTLLPRGQTVTSTDNGTTTTFRTCYTYDALGRRISETRPNGTTGQTSCPASQSGPAPWTGFTRYDAMGRVTGTISADPDAVGSGNPPLAVRNTYDGAGRLIRVETGVLAAWQSEAVAPSAWTGFTVQRRLETAYDPVGHKVRETVKDNAGAVQGVTDYSYDLAGRLDCTAVRMNPAQWANVIDACAAQPAGTQGPDRIAQNFYDAAGQRIQLREAVGVTGVEAAEATWAYNLNGQVTTVIDGNGNRAALVYDGHGRQNCWMLPSTVRPAAYDDASQATALSSAGSVSGGLTNGHCTSGDYESYAADPNGNRTSLRKRDGSVLGFTYDALNRLTVKNVPERPSGPQALTAAQTRDVYYGYDLRNLQTFARFDSASGEGVTNAFDGFGRLTASNINMAGVNRMLYSYYTPDGDRFWLIHPDNQGFGAYYDGLHRPYELVAGGATTYAYTWFFDHGGIYAVGRPGVTTAFNYDTLQRPSLLLHYLAAPTGNVAWALGRNPAGQVTSIVRDNDAFAYVQANTSQASTINGLNQPVAAAVTGAGGPGGTILYDLNGNLTTDPGLVSGGASTTTYVYDIENRLVSASGAHTATLIYDPLGRLWRVDSGSSSRTFLYDGDALVAEYNAAGAVTRRHGQSL